MRRQDREVSDHQAIEAFLRREQILRVAFYDQGDIYIVPVNYGFTCDDNGFTFYFHGAQAGRKYALSRECPTMGFEIDGGYRPVAGNTACEFTAEFQSVIGTGVLRLLSDRQEKIAGLNAVMRQLSGKDSWDYPEAMVDRTAVYCLRAKNLSCKAKYQR